MYVSIHALQVYHVFLGGVDKYSTRCHRGPVIRELPNSASIQQDRCPCHDTAKVVDSCLRVSVFAILVFLKMPLDSGDIDAGTNPGISPVPCAVFESAFELGEAPLHFRWAR